MKRALQLLRTARYLKWRQIYYRIYYRFTSPKLSSKPQPKLRNILGKWDAPRYLQPATSDGIAFKFLNVIGQIDSVQQNAKLWRYHAHYHDDLNSVVADSNVELCQKLVDNWILMNPSITGEGWEPYCISLRCVNWIKWFSRLDEAKINPLWVKSLACQIDVLDQRIEYHILGNHVFANAKALIFAGVYFDGKRGDRWLTKGLRLLKREVSEQFLNDGAHYELSPMYHAILLWDIVDLIFLFQLSQLPMLKDLSDHLQQQFSKSFDWLKDMVHPDNDIAFFNDATLKVAPRIDDLFTYAKSIGIELHGHKKIGHIEGKLNASSGYAIVEWPEAHKLIADVAQIGPDYQPGHGHADTLSCELSLFGQRVLVNSGISTYEKNDRRLNERSTASHNTVELNGKNSSDVWASFRVARRAKPFGVALSNKADHIEICGSHDGYHSRLNRNTHKRTWLAGTDHLIVRDNLTGDINHVRAYWHFHPAVIIKQQSDTLFHLKLSHGQVIRLNIDGAKVHLSNGEWSPEFGLSVPNKKISLEIVAPECITRLEWN